MDKLSNNAVTSAFRYVSPGLHNQSNDLPKPPRLSGALNWRQKFMGELTSVEESDALIHLRTDPHNLASGLALRSKETPINDKVIAACAVFNSSMAAQSNRAIEFETAQMIGNWASAKHCMAALGMAILDLHSVCLSGDMLALKKRELFHFNERPQQVGAVDVNDNPFVTGQWPNDLTLRELGAWVISSIGLPFLKTIHDICADEDLSKKASQFLDIDFYRRFDAEFGRETGVPNIVVVRRGLYDEGGVPTSRTAAPTFIAIANRSAKSLTLSEREKRYSGAGEKVPRSTGSMQFRILDKTIFARAAIATDKPVTAGPSGTALNFVLAARLLWPALQHRLNLEDSPSSKEIRSATAQFPRSAASQFSRLFGLTLMGYIHGCNDAEHHHSMWEILDGAKRADKRIEECYRDGLPINGVRSFGFKDFEVDQMLADFQRTLSIQYQI